METKCDFYENSSWEYLAETVTIFQQDVMKHHHFKKRSMEIYVNEVALKPHFDDVREA